MQKWEYSVISRGWNKLSGEWYWVGNKKLNLSIEERLNKLGQEGWELVSVVTIPDPDSSRFLRIDYYLKRSIN